jgi:hypothetical protein
MVKVTRRVNTNGGFSVSIKGKWMVHNTIVMLVLGTGKKKHKPSTAIWTPQVSL